MIVLWFFGALSEGWSPGVLSNLESEISSVPKWYSRKIRTKLATTGTSDQFWQIWMTKFITTGMRTSTEGSYGLHSIGAVIIQQWTIVMKISLYGTLQHQISTQESLMCVNHCVYKEKPENEVSVSWKRYLERLLLKWLNQFK